MKIIPAIIKSAENAILKRVLLSVAIAISATQATQGQVLLEQGENAATRIKQELETQKSIAARRMHLIIAEMERTCELSEKQIRQLQIAVNGTVSNFIRAKEIERKKQWRELGLPGIPAADDEELEPYDAEPEEEDLEPAPNGRIMIGAFGQTYNQYPAIEEAEIWKNTLRKVLTNEQLEKYTSVVNDRMDNSQRAAVGRFIANADRKLILAATQREQLFRLVDQSFGEQLAKSERTGLNMMEINMFIGLGRRPDDASAPINRELVSAILTDRQMEEWKHSFELQLNQLPSQ